MEYATLRWGNAQLGSLADTCMGITLEKRRLIDADNLLIIQQTLRRNDDKFSFFFDGFREQRISVLVFFRVISMVFFVQQF